MGDSIVDWCVFSFFGFVTKYNAQTYLKHTQPKEFYNMIKNNDEEYII